MTTNESDHRRAARDLDLCAAGDGGVDVVTIIVILIAWLLVALAVGIVFGRVMRSGE
jgi:hypothetical protein